MVVSATPVGLSRPRFDVPAGARIRFGAAKARGLQSRLGRRARLAVSVVTVIGSHQAVITRVTLYGACIGGGRRLKRREIIALRLPSGWRVKARVQWRFGSRCWIAFMTPVADFARILCEGAVVKPRGKRERASVTRPQFPIRTHEEPAPPVGPGPAAWLASLTKWAKMCADGIRAWGTAKGDSRDPRSG